MRLRFASGSVTPTWTNPCRKIRVTHLVGQRWPNRSLATVVMVESTGFEGGRRGPSAHPRGSADGAAAGRSGASASVVADGRDATRGAGRRRRRRGVARSAAGARLDDAPHHQDPFDRPVARVLPQLSVRGRPLPRRQVVQEAPAGADRLVSLGWTRKSELFIWFRVTP